MREIMDIHCDLFELSTELEGLKAMVKTVSDSIDHSNVIESDEEKLRRLSMPYFTLISYLDNIIKKIDVYADDLEDIDLHLRKEQKEIA